MYVDDCQRFEGLFDCVNMLACFSSAKVWDLRHLPSFAILRHSVTRCPESGFAAARLECMANAFDGAGAAV